MAAVDSAGAGMAQEPRFYCESLMCLHFVTKFKSWTLGFSLRVPNRYPPGKQHGAEATIVGRLVGPD